MLRILNVSYQGRAGVNGNQLADRIEAEFQRAKDWLLYAPGNYLLWTSKGPREWLQRLRAIAGLESVLILTVDGRDRAGLMQEALWRWIDDKLPRAGLRPEPRADQPVESPEPPKVALFDEAPVPGVVAGEDDEPPSAPPANS